MKSLDIYLHELFSKGPVYDEVKKHIKVLRGIEWEYVSKITKACEWYLQEIADDIKEAGGVASGDFDESGLEVQISAGDKNLYNKYKSSYNLVFDEKTKNLKNVLGPCKVIWKKYISYYENEFKPFLEKYGSQVFEKRGILFNPSYSVEVATNLYNNLVKAIKLPDSDLIESILWRRFYSGLSKKPGVKVELLDDHTINHMRWSY